MAKKQQTSRADSPFTPPLSGAVKESAQQIWLAGLGAFSKAQEEGGKVFETLVKEGLSLQRHTQAAAEEKISSASQKMSSLATDLGAKAGTQWDKLENVFEERVAKALNKLGVPSARELEALSARIDALSKQLEKTAARPAAAPRAAGAAGKTATARKTAAKRAPARKSA